VSRRNTGGALTSDETARVSLVPCGTAGSTGLGTDDRQGVIGAAVAP